MSVCVCVCLCVLCVCVCVSVRVVCVCLRSRSGPGLGPSPGNFLDTAQDGESFHSFVSVQSGHPDKNILGLTRVPYDLRFS